MKILTRPDLAKLPRQAPPGALVFAGEPAEEGLALGAAEIAGMQDLSRATLGEAGLGKGDRMLFALRQDGAPSVQLLAEAAQPLVSSVAFTNPKGRLRLLSTIRALKPNVLVITPCGAVDFLARLYLEFNVDPVELNLEKILLVGEIASPGVVKRIAKEFEAALAEIYLDPLFGAALAVREGKTWQIRDEALAYAPLDRDEIADGATREILLRPIWGAALKDTAVRTGQVIAGEAGDAGFFNRTVGEHVLVRGRWLSLPLLRRQLKLIDGLAAWTLTLDRGDRTLDSAALTVAFDRETLVDNPMWKGRVQQAVTAATPIHVDVSTTLYDPEAHMVREAVSDLRGHHLGVDRRAVG